MWCVVGQFECVQNGHVRRVARLHIEDSVWCVDTLVVLDHYWFHFSHTRARTVATHQKLTHPCIHPPILSLPLRVSPLLCLHLLPKFNLIPYSHHHAHPHPLIDIRTLICAHSSPDCQCSRRSPGMSSKALSIIVLHVCHWMTRVDSHESVVQSMILPVVACRVPLK